MKIKNIDHIVLTVADVEASARFYGDLLGMEREIGAGGRLAFKFGNQKINLHARPHEFEPSAKNATFGSADFCLIVEGDAETAKKELEARGAKIESGVVKRRGASGEMNSLYLRDPDGNLVEIASYE